MTTHAGSCAFGAIKIEAEGRPEMVSMCHCLQCQRRTGSTYSTHAYFRSERVVMTGTPSVYRRAGDTGCFIDFRFCPTCGSTVCWTVEAMPEVIGVPVGVFADPQFPKPTVSIFMPHKHAWVAVPEGVPQNDGHSEAFYAAAKLALDTRRAAGGPVQA